MSDFYGDRNKWFVGVVKDTADPLNSNRVRVRIKGIHPDEGDEDMSAIGGTGDSSSVNQGYDGEAATGSAPPALGQVKFDGELPNQGQLNGKISKHFCLRDLTVGAAGAQSSRTSAWGIQHGKLTQEIITNLSNLSTNCLDPIKERYPTLQINSGWRLGVSSADRSASGGNHPKGYAADISIPGRGHGDLPEWIKSNLRGRYNMLLVYPTFVHIQLGGSGRQGSTSSPYHGYGR